MDINNGMDSKLRTEVSDLITKTIVEVYETGFKKGYEAGKLVGAVDSVEDINNKWLAEREEKTPNQQRAELIEKAKEYVKVIVGKYDTFSMTVNGYKHQQVRPVFHVNEKKRTVTVLVYGGFSKKLLFKGMARCNPADVFNAWIGKAIALARALQIDIPVEFLKAIQPSEVVVGQRVLCGNFSYHTVANKIAQVIARENGLSNGFVVDALNAGRSDGFTWVNENNIQKIIDDTNAQYEGST